MASAVPTLLAALLLCAAAVSGENCQAAKAQAAEECEGFGCKQVHCNGDDFSATQCFGSVCTCVTTDGSLIKNYQFPVAIVGDCQCAVAQVAGSNEICLPNGSFFPGN